MVIRLTASQIPSYWDIIKWAAIQVDGIADVSRNAYLNNLLADLMGDKAQCFIRIMPDRSIGGIMITEIKVDKYSGERQLYIRTLYSFKPVSDEQWSFDMDILKRFADNEQITNIRFDSSNSRIWEIAGKLGFTELTRSFILSLQGGG